MNKKDLETLVKGQQARINELEERLRNSTPIVMSIDEQAWEQMLKDCKAELAELKRDWQPIDPADEGTLPERYNDREYRLSVHRIKLGDEIIIDAIYTIVNSLKGWEWVAVHGDNHAGIYDYTPVVDRDWIPYAWKEKERPAPYRKETQ